MTFEEWKAKHDDEIVNVATVFFNYERGVDTRTCYDELEWLLRKAFISGQNHCNHVPNEELEKENAEFKKQVKDLEWQLQEVVKDNDNYQADNKRLENENKHLQEQIVRMRRCENCRYKGQIKNCTYKYYARCAVECKSYSLWEAE